LAQTSFLLPCAGFFAAPTAGRVGIARPARPSQKGKGTMKTFDEVYAMSESERQRFRKQLYEPEKPKVLDDDQIVKIVDEFRKIGVDAGDAAVLVMKSDPASYAKYRRSNFRSVNG
jgi:hypothetical protein